jgi:hypothetical protein
MQPATVTPAPNRPVCLFIHHVSFLHFTTPSAAGKKSSLFKPVQACSSLFKPKKYKKKLCCPPNHRLPLRANPETRLTVRPLSGTVKPNYPGRNYAVGKNTSAPQILAQDEE